MFLLRALVVQTLQIYSKQFRNTGYILPFPGINHINADLSTINFVKFHANYFGYKFGYEVGIKFNEH